MKINNGQSNFIRLVIQSRCLDTFLKPFLRKLDLIMLKRSCKYLNQIIPNQDSGPHKITTIEAALRCGYFGIVKWLLGDTALKQIKSLYYGNSPYSAKDCLAQISILETSGLTPADKFCSALFCGNLPLMKELRITNPSLVRVGLSKVETLASLGHLHILKWLYEQNKKKGLGPNHTKILHNHTKILHNASENGHITILEWIFTESQKLTNYKNEPIGDFKLKPCVSKFAAKYKKLDILKFVHGKISFHIRTLEVAFESGDLEIVEWLLTNHKELKISEECVANATQHNHLHLLKLAVDKGLELTPPMIVLVACFGNLESIKWVHQLGFRFDNNLVRSAVDRGRSSILQFAINENYEVSWRACNVDPAGKLFSENGYSLLELLLSKNHSFDGIIEYAIEHSDITLLDWIKTNVRSLDNQWTTNLPVQCILFSSFFPLQVLEHLTIKLKCPYDSRVCEMASRLKKFDMFIWARQRSFPWDSTKCINNLIVHGKSSAISWLHKYEQLSLEERVKISRYL